MAGDDPSGHGAGPARTMPAISLDSSASHLGMPHILVVDDDAGVRYVATSILQRAHYRVTCAEDGEEAWNTLHAKHFDLLITDYSMPGLTGLALVRRMRAAAMSLPVILISADIPWREPDLGELIPSHLILAKPFSIAALLTCVRRCLSPAMPHADEIPLRHAPCGVDAE